MVSYRGDMLRLQHSPSRICGGQSGTETVLSPYSSGFTLSLSASLSLSLSLSLIPFDCSESN